VPEGMYIYVHYLCIYIYTPVVPVMFYFLLVLTSIFCCGFPNTMLVPIPVSAVS